MPRSYHLDLHEMAQINAGTWFEGSSLIPSHNPHICQWDLDYN